jgi:AcrR family transcriptional regulator
VPKVVDREQRRREIAAEVLKLIAREGLEAVSVRTVAAECGISPGAVQKYFPSKDDMVMRALELTEERLERRYAALPPDAGISELFLQALPLDEERREETAAITAFAARAAARADWADFIAEGYTAVHRSTSDYIRAAQQEGLLPATQAPEDLASGLIALSDGFAQRMLLFPPESEEVDMLLRAAGIAVHALLGIEQ